MKKRLWNRFLQNFSTQEGESYSRLFGYFLPEFVTALVLYSLVGLLDARFVAHLKSTSSYATLGMVGTLIHFITKIAEGLCVGTTILCGHYNGLNNYTRVGKSAISSFWLTVISGAFIGSFLYVCAPWICYWYGVPDKMIALGTPFLRVRAASIFCLFTFFSIVGFLRGIKNTRIPMLIFVIGAVIFLFL